LGKRVTSLTVAVEHKGNKRKKIIM